LTALVVNQLLPLLKVEPSAFVSDPEKDLVLVGVMHGLTWFNLDDKEVISLSSCAAGNKSRSGLHGRIDEVMVRLHQRVSMLRRAVSSLDFSVPQTDYECSAFGVREGNLGLGEPLRGDLERLTFEPLVVGRRTER